MNRHCEGLLVQCIVGAQLVQHPTLVQLVSVHSLCREIPLFCDRGPDQLRQEPRASVVAAQPHVAKPRGNERALRAKSDIARQRNAHACPSGGTWDAHSESFQGQIAEQVLRSYDFDQLFIGCDGIDLERGTTTFNELLGLSRVMAEAAREVIVLAEADKVGRRIPNLELPWSAVNILITDDRLSTEQQTLIEQQGVRVIIATPGNGE